MYKTLATGPIGVQVPFAEAVDLAARHGFEGIALSLADVQSLGIAETKDLLQARGVRAALTGVPVNFREDDATFERDLATLPAFCETMTAVGCMRMVTWISPSHPTLGYLERFKRLAIRTKRMCQVLHRYGMRLGLEYVGPETSRRGRPNPFIHSLDGMLGLIASVDEPNLGLLLDAWHWYTARETKEDLLSLSDDLVVAVHVNDAPAGVPVEEQDDHKRALPGETGVIDIQAFMEALVELDYSGPVMVEPFSDKVRALPPEEAVALTARSLERIWPKDARGPQ
ncbi:MAG: sugar phosphate isomerase/epimerase [Chloroflexi bacterium]|nr:sugar phosphate isomerase/epimerase [Chloroflexota bacterium]